MSSSNLDETKVPKGLTQKEILLTLIQGEDGIEWTRNTTGWQENYTYGVCYWDHVFCDTVTGQDVTRIIIEGKNLHATVPSYFGLLKELKELSIPHNQIAGTFPDEVAKLSNLEIVNLHSNRLTGTLPDFTSSKLKTIDFGLNNLTGRINHDIGIWNPLLENFDVSKNAITGPIPPTFSRCKLLDTLDLSDNEITGTIPYSLGSCSKLRYLYLNHNHIMGTIPPQIAMPDAMLAELWLHDNLMTGTIPASLSDLPLLFDFYIDGNKFTGTIPTELCNETINKEFFSKAEETDAKSYCESIACPPGYYSEDGLYPCVPCSPNTFSPYLGHRDNCYSTDQNFILKRIFDSTNGPQWTNIDSPWIGGDICSFTGISCNSADQVTGINLSNKGLKGSIPSELGFLRLLEELDLSNNELTGFLPSDLVWPPITKLDLSGNHIKGIVPPELCFEEGINDNGKDGKYSCRNIACPVGTYSHNGRGFAEGSKSEERNNQKQCESCPSGTYLAAKTCDFTSIEVNSDEPLPTYAATSSAVSIDSLIGLLFICVFTFSFCVYLSYMRLRDHKLKKRVQTAMEQDRAGEWEVDDYGNELKILRNQIAPTDVTLNDDDEDEVETSNMVAKGNLV